MKRKLFFITLLMLFCSSMFGQQHWTMADNLDYSNTKLIIADIKIEGETPANMEDLEVAAFSNGVLRGVAKPAKVFNKYILRLTVHTNFNGEQINFKLYDPSANEGEGKEYDTDYTIKLLSNDQSFGTVVSPVEMNFYSMHWSYINVNDNYMAYPCIIKIDGVEQTNPNLELAAFINNELRGVARPKLEEAINIYIANLKIDGNNGQTIIFKLYVPEVGELETDYTAIYDIDYDNGLVTLEFRNNPVAKIVRNEITHYFASLTAAVAAAQDGETILLLQNVTLTETLTIEKSITIDGDGFEIKPADATKTYNSAIMVGNSGWGDDHGEVITLNNIKLNNWKTNYGVVRAQGVTLNMTVCEFNGNEVTDVANGAYGVLSLNFTDATVTNSIFEQNKDRAIDINYNGDNSNAEVTIEGCTFEKNVSDGAGIVVRNDGDKLVVTNSKFLNNTVTTTGNAATIYAGWGEQDEVSGCTFSGNTVTTSHATTKRFASAIFCDGCTVTGNAFEANTATRNGETITTTVAVGAFYGAANISENYWGGNAPVPGVDYTVEYTYYNVAINDYYKEYSEGTLSDKVTLNNVAKAGKYYYESITAAFAAVQDGETVTMLHDVSLSESIKVNNNITLDLNGKTITGTDNETASFALFEVQPSKELTVKDENNTGKITLTATNNRGWNAYSSVISNQRGKLTVNGGTIEHLGGTDMAYGIDNLTNGKGTYAETIINGGTVKSLYRAIRQFLNGIEAQNILTVNGGTIEGANKSIWMQSANANANPGKLTIVEGVTVKGNILLEAEPNATSWPVEVSIVASTLKDGAQVMTEDLPSGYELVLENGVYSVYHGVAKIGNNYYDDLSSALKAITSGCTLEILTDITISSDWDCRNTGAKIGVPVTINGNGKTIKFTGKIYDANWNTLFRFEDVATVKNLTLDASAATDIQRGITFKTSVTVDNCTLIGNGGSARYAVIVGEGAGAENIGNVTANITNSTFKNWKNGVTDNMNGQDMKEFAITGCTFDNTDVIISAKDNVTFTGNNMSSNSYVNITSYTVPNNVQVVANNNTNLAANTETECNQIAAPLAKINAQDGFLTPVAEINGKYFTTLQAAINAAAEDETVKLLADVNYSLDPSTFTAKHGDDDAALFVLADDKLTIDLNGNTISVVATLPEGAATAHSGAIINNGDLTIDDSSDEKEGKVTFEYVGIYDDGYKRHGVVMNLGTLTVNAGTLENVTELQNQQAIDNTNYNKTEVSVVINGGTIKSAGYYAIDMVGYYDFAPALKNSVVINNGTIDGGVYARIQNNTNLSLNITGGVIKSDFAEAVRYRVHYPGNTHSISITGGEFSTTNAESQVVRVQLAEGESLAGFISAGTFSQDVNEFCAAGFMCVENDNGTYGVVVDPDYGMVAKIGETRYETLSKAFAAVQEGQTIELLPVTITIEQGTVKLPATLKNVTVKGVEGAVLKDMTIMAADGNSINYEGITFDGVVFDNSRISVTGWRNNGVVVKDFTVTNCRFYDLHDETSVAPVHFNMAATEPVNGFTFTNNVIDGATGGSKSGVYAQVTGETVFTNNVINNVSFRPYVIQLTTDDGIADEFTVTGNTFSGSAAGRAQGLGNNDEGTDAVTLTVSNNIFKDITAAQQICYWNFNEATTTATLEKNYYDIDVVANPDRIYYNSPAQNISELSEMGIFPIYEELNDDGTINEESLFDPVAYVETKAFETLDEAFAGQDGTIVLLKNIELTEGLTVAADKTFTLDLNGKVVSGVSSTAGSSAVITNNGNLTVKTSVEGGKITSKSLQPDVNWGGEGEPSYPSYANNTIVNRGTFTLVSGTVENTTAAGGATYAIDNYNGSTTNIEGGEVYCENNLAIRLFCGDNISLNIDGGKIQGTRALWIQLANSNSSVAPNVEVNISNGEIRATGEKNGYIQALYSYSYGNDMKNVEINISGGTFYGDINLTGGSNKTNIETLNISGGIFNGNEYDINSYGADEKAVGAISITGGTFSKNYAEKYALDDGFVFVKNADGKYELDKLEEGDEINISNLNELIAFRNAVNAGNDFAGKVFKLKEDINLNPTRAIINYWEPIGTQANPFKGTFDGGDNTISNLNVDGGAYVGLFGYADNATIKNVKIENANVKGTDCVGVIAGSVYSESTIENCHISGLIQVEGLTKVGGIHGYGYAKIINSSVVGNNGSYVKGTYNGADKEGDNVGGIVGHGGEGNTISACTVKNISVIGTRKVGGIVGTTDRAKVLDNCLVDGIVIENTAEAAYAGDNVATTTIGGLIGNYHGTGKGGSVINCVVKNVTFNVGNAKNVGPIVGGYRLKPNEEITDVTASGNLVYMSTITDNTTNMYLMNAVAKIDETKYYTLQEAVAASETNETTIDVIANTAETINVQEGANITINNINLTGSILAPNATLKIVNGSIVNNNSNVSAIEINAGTLNLEGVNISSARHAVRIDGAVTAEVNGGTYKSAIGEGTGTYHALNIGNKTSQVAANVTIKAGTFEGPKGTTADSGSAVNVQTGSTVTINGGEFSGGKNATLGVSGTMIVKGGKFDQDPSAYLADAYTVNIENEMYVVRYTPIKVTYPVGNPVYPEGKVEYYSDMLEAVPYTTNCPRLEGATITLLADVSGAGMRFMENDMVFDLNGHTYTITAGTGSLGTNTSGFQIRSEVTTNVLFKNGTIKVAEGAPVVWMFNCYATDFIVEDVTVDCSNMAYSYGEGVYVVVSRSGDNVQLKGQTKIANFDSTVAGYAINVGGTMTIGEEVDLGENAVIELDGGAQLTAPAGLNVVTVGGYMVVYENGVYKSVKVVAQVGENKFGSVIAALNYAIANNAAQVKIVSDSRELMPTDVYLILNADLEITAEQPYTVQFYNNGSTSYDFVVGSNNNNTLTFGKNVTFQLEDRIIWLGYYDNNVDVVVNGTLAAKQIWHGADTQVTSTGTIKSTGEAFVMRRGATLTVDGGTVNASYFNILAGNIDAENANITCGAMWIANTGNYIYEGNVNINIKSSTLTSNGNLKSSTAHADGVSINFENSEVTFVLFDGYGVSDIDANTKLNVKGTNAAVSIKGLTNNGLVNVTETAKLTLTGTVTNNGAMKLDATSVIYAPENLGVTIDDNDYDVVYENGAYRAVHKPFVAEVDGTQYTSLQAAINAADGKTVVVLDNITLTETVTVAAGTTVTLDLNGKTVSAGATFAVKAIVNNGTLTINGNGGTIDISASTTESIQVVDNYGTLTINGGTYKGASSNFSYAIRANHENSVTNIVGATITTYFGAVGINKGETTITDGKFEVTSQAGGHALYVVNAEVTINGGEFIPYANGYSYAVLTNDANAKVSITGGTFKKGLGDSCVKALSGNIIITGGTFSTDVNGYCHEYYDAVTEDNITWTVEQVLFAQTTELQAGWNWYSSYINLASDEELVEMQNAFDGKGLEIKGKTGFSDYQYIGDDVNGVAQYKWYKTEDFSISAKQMYMIKTTEALDLVVDGKVVNPAANPISLKVGWNWIGYPMTENVAINVALENLEAEPGDVIKSRNGESEYIEGYGWYGDILTMEPGVGYKYYSQKRTTFVYNSTADNSRYVNENVTPDNNYWLPEVSQYADNMSIVAMLNIDGEIAKDNYEIAAFVNGECRGSARPVYIEALDVYVVFMMVFGEESEELSFKYYDVDYETEYELNDVITYCSDSRIGSVNNPYMFNLDILNIDESSVEDINIYPNPTTTGSEINLQAVCDKVEVFNALGVKVAEYTNVDSIDAIETAGVYVIRLTIDNSARNCRLIVK